MITIIFFAIFALSHSLEITDIQQTGPKIYYAGVCEAAECRYGTCEIYNSTTYRCHCLKVK